MRRAVRFIRPPEQEMLEAAKYYELQAPGLGVDFLARVASAVQDIAEDPECWPSIHYQIRRRLIHRFPYGLLYRIDPEEIVILATMHLHRHPDYWAGRL